MENNIFHNELFNRHCSPKKNSDRFSRDFFKGLFVLILCFSLFFTFNPGRAAETYHDFDIQPKPLAEALIEFSKQTGFQFFFENEVLEGIKNNYLKGKFSTQQGLEILLDGTEVVFSVRAGTVIVFEKQQTADAPLQNIENVTVVGARAKGLGFGGIVPVTVINSEEFSMNSATDGTQIFSHLPQTNPVISITNSNARILGVGTVLVDLRNLGPNRTLVLVNGRRFAQTGSFPPLFSATDISTIPIDFVDRIEILTGSASTLYGSDAVAGVINFNLKTNFEGLEGNLLTGISEKGDGEIFKVSLSGGQTFSNGKAHLSGHLTFSKEGKILQKDRPLLSNPGELVNGVFQPGAAGSSTVPSGLIVGFEDAAENLIPFFVSSGPPPLLISDDGNSFSIFTGAPEQLFDFSDFQFLSLPKTRFLLNLNGEYEFGLGKETFFSFFAGSSTAKNLLAPPPLTLAIGQAIRIPFDNPFIPQSLQPFVDQLQADGATAFLMDKRIMEAGGRDGTVKKDFQYFLWGVSGPVGPFENFEFSYQYSTSKTTVQDNVVIDLEKVQIAADPTLCATAPGCTLIDFFGINKISQGQLDFIKNPAPVIKLGKSTQHLISAYFSGALAETQAGKINVILGLEFRREKFSVTPDPSIREENQSGLFGLAETKGSYNVFEAFFDVVTPLIKNRKKIRSLSWEFALRASHFNTIGTIFNWKTGFEYVPVNGFRIRTMFQKGVREPNIQEFFTPINQSAFRLRDPCSNLAAETRQNVISNCLSPASLGNVPTGFLDPRTSITGTFSGNTALLPERSQSVTFSFSYIPTQGQFLGSGNFYFSFDLYWIKIKSPIFLPPLSTMLEQCYESPGFSSAFCGTNPKNGLPFFERDPITNQITNVNLAVLNGASETIAGFDFEIRYTLFGKKLGLQKDAAKFDFIFLYTLNVYQEFFTTPGGDRTETTGQISRPFNRIFFQTTLTLKAFQVFWTTQFQTSGILTFSLPSSSDGNLAPSTFYHDLAFRKELRKDLYLTLGIDNFFNKAPPILLSGNAGTNTIPNLFDIVGRRFWLRLGITF